MLWRIRNTRVGRDDRSGTVSALLITFVDPRCATKDEG